VRIDAFLSSLPAGTMLSVEAIRALLADDSPTPEQFHTDFSADEVGEMYNRTAACIRFWCHAGKLPGAYKLNDREWRIPQDAPNKFQERQRKAEKATVGTFKPVDWDSA
jgi:hypothetical protein